MSDAVWETTTQLLPHQVEAVTKMLPSRVGGLFMEMGTGKTRTAIELARLRREKIGRVIWFCPVSLKFTVEYEIQKHTTCSPKDVFVFDGRTREDNVPLDCFWYIVGIESMSLSSRVFYSVAQLVSERCMVIVDEASFIKGPLAKRTKRITLMSERARYRLVLTGTPITQGVVDLYAQMRFLSEKILGYQSFYAFANNHLVYSSKYRDLIIGVRNRDWIIDRIKPYVYQVTKDECLTLPDKIYGNRYCELTSEQRDAYEKVKEDFVEDVLRYDDERNLENGIAVFRLFSRLQSIACGIYDGAPIENNRLGLFCDVATRVRDSHVVVWVKYRQNLRDVVALLDSMGRKALALEGGVTEKKRQGVLNEWRDRGGFLVATQAVGSFGLDLTAAATTIFYARGFKYAESVQAEDRCHRIGQTRRATYVSLWALCGIEDRIETALRKKENTLERLRRDIEEVKSSRRQKLRDFIMRL